VSRLHQTPRRPLIKRLAIPSQHHRIAELAGELNMEKPTVFWSHDAVEVIKRLEAMKRQPVLTGFAASTSALTKGEK
jgi:hypothetical protein